MFLFKEAVLGIRPETSDLRHLSGDQMERYLMLSTPLEHNDATEYQRRTTAQSISRLAAEGHRGMLELNRQIVDRNLSSGGLPDAVQRHIIAIAELLD